MTLGKTVTKSIFDSSKAFTLLVFIKPTLFEEIKMKLKMLAFSLMFALFLTSVPPISAKQSSQTNDWNSLKNYLNSEVAIETTNQKTVRRSPGSR